MRHGQGKFFYQDGGMYDGEWIKNKMEGYGKLYYQSGTFQFIKEKLPMMEVGFTISSLEKEFFITKIQIF